MKRLLHSKENNKQREKTYRKGGKIFTGLSSNNGLILELKKIKYRRKKILK